MAYRARIVATVLLIMVGGVMATISTSSAQPTTESITVVDARITGDGPVTSWLGGPASRTLLLTIDGATIDSPTPRLRLWVGKGDEVASIAAPDLGPLTPGEPMTISVPFSLDALSFGTHAVTGELQTASTVQTFRAETTHVPWLLLLLPTLVLIQLVLVTVRNRTRRYLHQPVSSLADDPIDISDGHDATEAGSVRAMIEHELDAALIHLTERPRSESELRSAVEHHARAATERISDRLGLPATAQPQLAADIATALLDRAATSPSPPL